jgi:hypothetical protein
MNTVTENNFDEALYANLKSSLPAPDYEAFISFKKREKEMDEFKTQQRLEQRKKDAGQDFFNRKDALILRRVKAKKRENEFCTEDEVLAFVDIHKMKKAKEVEDGTYQEKMRIEVSDEDIAAFLELEGEGHFYKDISLEMISTKVADTEGGGGDNQGEEVIAPAA